MKKPISNDLKNESPKLLLHLLLHVSRLIDEKIRNDLSLQGLHQGQARVLDALLAQGPMTVTQIAHCLHIAQPTATILLNRMDNAGLTERLPSDDARQAVAGLSKQGKKAAKTVRDTWYLVENEVVALLSPEETEAAHEVLLLIRNSLGGASPIFSPKKEKLNA
jgi:DNA-binding MarR family transcriptional regulator